MDSVEVQEFLLTTTANNASILLETDHLFDENNANNTTGSLYYSIADDTLSNRLVDELKVMEKTLTAIEEEEVSQQTLESIIVQQTTQEEQFFQNNLHLKPFPNHPMTQCSTPKVEAPIKQKTPSVELVPPEEESKLDASLGPVLQVLPLPTIMAKIAKSVTIVEAGEKAENKENVQIPMRNNNLRKSLKPRDGLDVKSVIPAKKPTLRKSMIPNAPSHPTVKATTIKEEPNTNKPSLMARKSMRLSVVPNKLKAARFTIGGRSGKVNSPKTKKTVPIPKTSSSLLAQRMTINFAAPKPLAHPKPSTTETVLKTVVKEERLGEIKEDDKANKRMSRIPSKGDTSKVADFACTVCKKSFHLKSTLLTHEKIHMAKGAASWGHFKCAYCDKDFEKEVGLRNHIERYCLKVPVADKRKLDRSHNRTTSAEFKDRSKKEKSSSRLESTSSSVGSSSSATEQSLTVKKEQQQGGSSLSPRKPIKSISHPHSGIKFSANKPIKCYHCQITFNKYVDFHAHVDKVHPQPGQSRVGKEEGIKKEVTEEVK